MNGGEVQGLPESREDSFETRPESSSGSEVDCFLIGQIAELLNLQPQTIRFYERHGLVRPRRLGRLRIYGKRDLRTLEFVRYLRKLDLPLRSIRRLINDTAEGDSLSLDSARIRDFLRQHLTTMKAAQSNLEAQISDLSARLGLTAE
jgi:DNA-binding transcriptional MerR regulator